MIAHYFSVAMFVMLVVTTAALPAMKNDAMMTTTADLSEPQTSQPVGTRPRTWNKPYYGTPSVQCRRNPGIGSWPSSEAEEAPQFTDLARSDDSSSRDHTASSSTILPRQPHNHAANTNNNLLAAFHYTCPQGGAMSQVFMWGVVYIAGATNVQMVPWHNILGFTGTSLIMRTGSWASAWGSRWCVPHDKLECWYTAFGFTVGTLSPARDSISIDLVINRADPSVAPTILENCVEIGASRAGTRGASCIIQEVNVHVQGPRG